MRRQTQQLRRRKLPNNYDIKNINSHFTKGTKTIKPMTGLINHVNTENRLFYANTSTSKKRYFNEFNFGVGLSKELVLHTSKSKNSKYSMLKTMLGVRFRVPIYANQLNDVHQLEDL